VAEKPSYTGAFFRHPYNRVALLLAGCAGVFLSIPLGWTGLALVGVVAVGTEVLAALGIPEIPAFRQWVDRQHRATTREQRRERLLTELRQSGAKNALTSYQHMCSRVVTLYHTARDSQTTLTLLDVEKLDDLTVDFLGLCAVHQSLKLRKDHAEEDTVVKRIAALQAQLHADNLPNDEVRQLNATLAQYSDMMQRARRLAVRRSGLEATLIALPDKLEEVYQLVITAPFATDVGGRLEESLSRLRIAEEVAAEFDDADTFDLTALAAPISPALVSQSAQSGVARAAARIQNV